MISRRRQRVCIVADRFNPIILATHSMSLDSRVDRKQRRGSRTLQTPASRFDAMLIIDPGT
jgi:hypothetical protein